MKVRTKAFTAVVLAVLAFAAVPQAAHAKPNEFDAVAKHLKTKYRAKKVRMGFVWLARLAVKVVKPAGVKSFNVTLFEDLKFSRDSLDTEMQSIMRSSFGPEWDPVFRVRSNDGEQAYMYMREAGKNVKIALVTINNDDAALIRATFSPEKLADFINNPKILGIPIGSDDKHQYDDAVTSNDPPDR
ncbi:MAG: hypothetical protein AB7J13_02060 [Pyrinomonadaceae bacterium]